MANTILTAKRLSNNDIASLANIIEANLKYYHAHASPFKEDYLKKLRTVVGLGFLVILVDGGLISIYRPHLDIFLKNTSDVPDFSDLSLYCISIAEMIVLAASRFKTLEYPNYYRDFLGHLGQIVKNIPTDLAGKGKVAKELLEKF